MNIENEGLSLNRDEAQALGNGAEVLLADFQLDALHCPWRRTRELQKEIGLIRSRKSRWSWVASMGPLDTSGEAITSIANNIDTVGILAGAVLLHEMEASGYVSKDATPDVTYGS